MTESKRLVRLFLAIAAAFCCLPVANATPPLIVGPNNSTSAAFWYLGGFIQSCCVDIPNLYYAQWPLYLYTNTTDPNPTIQWSTDSPSKVEITPT